MAAVDTMLQKMSEKMSNDNTLKAAYKGTNIFNHKNFLTTIFGGPVAEPNQLEFTNSDWDLYQNHLASTC